MTIIGNEMLWHQFGAAIDELGSALRDCPDELWEKKLWEDEPDQWVVLYYTNQRGAQMGEYMEISPQGKGSRVVAKRDWGVLTFQENGESVHAIFTVRMSSWLTAWIVAVEVQRFGLPPSKGRDVKARHAMNRSERFSAYATYIERGSDGSRIRNQTPWNRLYRSPRRIRPHWK